MISMSRGRLLTGTATIISLAVPAYGQNTASVRESNSLDAVSIQGMTAPRYSRNTPMGGVDYGDDLGNHEAERALDMSNFGIYNLADPTGDRPDMAANKNYVDQVGAASRDNLGDHTATQNLDMDNYQIQGLGAPTGPNSAATKQYVDSQTAGAMDNLGDHTATQALDMDGNRITDIGTPVNDNDAANKSYVDQVGAASKDNLGDHTAVIDLNMAGNKIKGLGEPTDNGDAATKSYVDASVTAVGGNITTITGDLTNLANDVAALEGRKITAGTGLSGGGDLSADRTLSFDTSWGDARYTVGTRRITTAPGSGLTGGGPLSSDLTLGLEPEVMRTDVAQTITEKQTFTQGIDLANSVLQNLLDPTADTDAANKNYVDDSIAAALASSSAVQGTRTITAGTGLTGGGDLSADRTLSFDKVWGDTQYVGMSGDQTIGGHKTLNQMSIYNGPIATLADIPFSVGARDDFSLKFYSAEGGNIAQNNIASLAPPGKNASFTISVIDDFDMGMWEFRPNGTIGGIADPTRDSDAANKSYVDRRYRTAGSVDKGFMGYNGTTYQAGAFYSGAVNPDSVNRLNYDGYLYATRFYSNMYLYFSDRNLKENIETIAPEAGIETVRKANPVSYHWKDSGHKALGLIAQEVEEIIPTAVKTNEAGIKSVDYVQMIAPMLAAIQDLDGRLAKLENQ